MLNEAPFHAKPPKSPPGISFLIGRPKVSVYQAASAFGSFAWELASHEKPVKATPSIYITISCKT
jgi:hypothetical protein